MALTIELSNNSLVITGQTVNADTSIVTRKYYNDNKGACSGNCTNSCSTNGCNLGNCVDGDCNCRCGTGSSW
jgi:hypothetical protein